MRSWTSSAECGSMIISVEPVVGLTVAIAMGGILFLETCSLSRLYRIRFVSDTIWVYSVNPPTPAARGPAARHPRSAPVSTNGELPTQSSALSHRRRRRQPFGLGRGDRSHPHRLQGPRRRGRNPGQDLRPDTSRMVADHALGAAQRPTVRRKVNRRVLRGRPARQLSDFTLRQGHRGSGGARGRKSRHRPAHRRDHCRGHLHDRAAAAADRRCDRLRL